MNICLLTSDFLPNVGGMATHAHELAKALAGAGHALHIVHPVYEQGRNDFVEQFDGIIVHRLFIENETPRFKHLVYVARVRSYIKRLHAAQRIDLIHWHDLTPNCWTTRTLRRRFPLVWTNHTSNYLEFCETRVGRIKIRAYLRHPDAIISPSRELNEKSIRTGVRPEWLFYIPNGVDAAKFHPGAATKEIEATYGLDPAKPIVICPRRLEPKNGVEYFIRAVPLVRESCPDAQFLIVGGGFPEERERFEKMLDGWGLRSAVVFTGNVPNDTMPRFYAASDLAILPSLMEATSISGLEAMSSGLPLIGTKVGGIPEIIEDGASGILVEPRNPEQLAGQIARLLEDPAERRRLGIAARERVERHFSWDAIAGRTLEVYERVLARRGRAR